MKDQFVPHSKTLHLHTLRRISRSKTSRGSKVLAYCALLRVWAQRSGCVLLITTVNPSSSSCGAAAPRGPGPPHLCGF